MERPQTVLGLTKHLVTQRWQALSSRGRILTLAALTAASFTTVAAAHHVLGGACCGSSCAARRAHMEAEAAALANADPAGGDTGCAHAAAH